MMPVIDGMVLAVSNSLAGSIVAKVTITIASGLIAAWLARGNRAAVRHALLAAIFVATLLLPAAAVLMPPLQAGVPVRVESPTAMFPLAMSVDAAPSVRTVRAGTGVNAGAARGSNLSLANLLFAEWGAGVALFLLPVIAGLWQIRSLRRSGLPWRRGQSVVEALAPDVGIDRRVEVRFK